MFDRKQPISDVLFPHPFSLAYWRAAAAELKSTKVLVFAALMIALRIIFKLVSIPVAADLRINFGFLVNAVGSMVFGPVVAIPAAAITDTLGYLVAPNGPYFFPFIFQEIAGSLLFALFFYRAKITVRRVVLCRFSICFLVNLVLTTPIMMLYYQVFYGRYYAPIDMLRIVKNLALFPIESVMLTALLRAVIPALRKAGLVRCDAEALRFTRRNVIALVVLALLSAGLAAGYGIYSYNHTSLSASYTASERFDANERARAIYLSVHPEEGEGEDLVVIIESAYPFFGSDEITYTGAVYRADTEALRLREADGGVGLEGARGYSKSKARADTLLTPLAGCEWAEKRGSEGFYAYTDWPVPARE
ncbi:MAG: folate family ECF transporter S component [Clostridia bacterium]|nr:folate family ECF transporter S component [Clostridia bacterium]